MQQSLSNSLKYAAKKMLEPVVLYCKSYEGDIHRVKRLWSSIEKFNTDNIKFFISVPEKNLQDFRNVLPRDSCIELLADEVIISAGDNRGLKHYAEWPGQLSQQVVKSEFWRLQQCENYILLDSDNLFIKNFSKKDFLANESVPYTVISQGKEFLQLANNKSINKVHENFQYESNLLKEILGRVGPDYDFGIPPVVWSRKVWIDLQQKYLEPTGISFWDAIKRAPIELRWYGEALLCFESIPLIPVEPFFRAYLYDWQYHHCKRDGETIEKLKLNFLGVVYQSNWETSLDSQAKRNQKSAISRALRASKRYLSRFR